MPDAREHLSAASLGAFGWAAVDPLGVAAPPPCSNGHAAPTRGSSKTTTTATSAIADARSQRCSDSTRMSPRRTARARVSFASARSARQCSRRCVSASASSLRRWLRREPMRAPSRTAILRSQIKPRSRPLSPLATTTGIYAPCVPETLRGDRFHFARELDGAIALAPASAGTHVIGWAGVPCTRRLLPTKWARRVFHAASSDGLVIFP